MYFFGKGKYHLSTLEAICRQCTYACISTKILLICAMVYHKKRSDNTTKERDSCHDRQTSIIFHVTGGSLSALSLLDVPDALDLLEARDLDP